MSVLAEFTMFPMDKGESVSRYVSQIVKMIDKAGLNYRLTSMGTIIEAETMEEITNIINESYKLLEADCNRVYSAVKFDIRKGDNNRLERKVDSVEEKIGKVDK